jgi:hypothetical protein
MLLHLQLGTYLKSLLMFFFQSCGHWLLSNALHVTIIVTLKFKKEFGLATYVEI